MSIELKTGSILDLPIERQQEIAKEDGMELEEWQTHMKKILAQNRAFIAELSDERSENLTEEDAKRFQLKIDSGNVGFFTQNK